MYCLPLPVCHAAALHCELMEESPESGISCLILFFLSLYRRPSAGSPWAALPASFSILYFSNSAWVHCPSSSEQVCLRLFLPPVFFYILLRFSRTLRGGSSFRSHVLGQRCLLVVQPPYWHGLSHSTERLGCPRFPALLHQLPPAVLAHQALLAGDTRPRSLRGGSPCGEWL